MFNFFLQVSHKLLLNHVKFLNVNETFFIQIYVSNLKFKIKFKYEQSIETNYILINL